MRLNALISIKFRIFKIYLKNKKRVLSLIVNYRFNYTLIIHNLIVHILTI